LPSSATPPSSANRGPAATTPESTHRLIKRGITALALVLSFSTGYILATNQTVVTAVAIASQPSDEKTLALWKPDANTQAGRIELQLQDLPLVKSLSADPKWKASRPHLKIPPNLKPLSFTGGHLLSDDKIPVPPLIFTTGDGKELVGVFYLGPAVCGHPGIVHGGLLATLMDEGLARTCFAALPSKVGMTANLNINYRSPCRAGQFVVLRAETTKVDGRKAWVKGRLETLGLAGGAGKTLVEADALFIEPKGFTSKLMKLST
jgi:hypothetical protein